MKKILSSAMVWAGAVLLPTASASADLRVSVQRLSDSLDRLEQTVRYSGRIDYQTNIEVHQLAIRAEGANYCLLDTMDSLDHQRDGYGGYLRQGPGPGPRPMDPYRMPRRRVIDRHRGGGGVIFDRDRDGRGDVRVCIDEVQDVLNSSYRLDQLLGGTYYSDVGVYSQYQLVRQALDDVRYDLDCERTGNVGGGYGPSPSIGPIGGGQVLLAQGALDGLMINIVGANAMDINSQCQSLAYRSRLISVQAVSIAGMQFQKGYGQRYSIQEACNVVSSHAIRRY